MHLTCTLIYLIRYSMIFFMIFFLFDTLSRLRLFGWNSFKKRQVYNYNIEI